MFLHYPFISQHILHFAVTILLTSEKDFLLVMCMPHPVCVCAHEDTVETRVSVGFHRAGLQAVRSSWTRVLRTEPWSSGRAASAPNH